VTFTKSYNPKPGGEGGRRWRRRGLDRRRGRRPEEEARAAWIGGGAAWIGGADNGRRRRQGRKEMCGGAAWFGIAGRMGARVVGEAARLKRRGVVGGADLGGVGLGAD
jgi:hypothetical protein